ESRLIFLFHDIAELSYFEICIIMEMKEENVRKIVSRSRAKVKNFINRNCILYTLNSNCKCRIQKHVISVDLKKEYAKLANIANMVTILKKFDEEFPRKNYWEQFI
ncbi:MAG: sigma factor-like helix-turn-helix DNA-binding protein, partial [Bacteroidales bacterium]